MICFFDLLIKVKAEWKEWDYACKVKTVVLLTFLVWWLVQGSFMLHVCPRTTLDFPWNHDRGMNPNYGSGIVSFLGHYRNERLSLKATFPRNKSKRSKQTMWGYVEIVLWRVWSGRARDVLLSARKCSEEKSKGCNALPCRQGIKGTEDTRQSCRTRQGELAPSGKRPQCPSWHFSRWCWVGSSQRKSNSLYGW